MSWMMVVMWKVFSHLHTQWIMNEIINEANDYVINVGLLKGFLNRTLMNEWEISGWTLFMSRDVVSSDMNGRLGWVPFMSWDVVYSIDHLPHS